MTPTARPQGTKKLSQHIQFPVRYIPTFSSVSRLFLDQFLDYASLPLSNQSTDPIHRCGFVMSMKHGPDYAIRDGRIMRSIIPLSMGYCGAQGLGTSWRTTKSTTPGSLGGWPYAGHHCTASLAVPTYDYAQIVLDELFLWELCEHTPNECRVSVNGLGLGLHATRLIHHGDYILVRISPNKGRDGRLRLAQSFCVPDEDFEGQEYATALGVARIGGDGATSILPYDIPQQRQRDHLHATYWTSMAVFAWTSTLLLLKLQVQHDRSLPNKAIIVAQDKTTYTQWHLQKTFPSTMVGDFTKPFINCSWTVNP